MSAALTVFIIHCIFALLALLLDAYIELRASRDYRRSLPEDLKFAMYQYMVEEEARPTVDNLHTQMDCCGINNVTDWTTVTYGAQMKSVSVSPPFEVLISSSYDNSHSYDYDIL